MAYSTEKREEIFENRSEKWQESDKGDEFLSFNADMEDAILELESAIDTLENLI